MPSMVAWRRAVAWRRLSVCSSDLYGLTEFPPTFLAAELPTLAAV